MVTGVAQLPMHPRASARQTISKLDRRYDGQDADGGQCSRSGIICTMPLTVDYRYTDTPLERRLVRVLHFGSEPGLLDGRLTCEVGINPRSSALQPCHYVQYDLFPPATRRLH